MASPQALPSPADLRDMITHYRQQVGLAETDYAAATRRRAQTDTMVGAFMGAGVVAVVLLVLGGVAWLIDYFLRDVDADAVAAAFGCAAAGALGACTSVSFRVLTFGELRVDVGASVLTLRGLGCVRPIVGAIFGVAAYFALKSGFINLGTDDFYFFAFFSFVAGFSERLVPDLVQKTEEAKS